MTERTTGSITEKIYDNLKNRILFNELPPGSKISENMLTDEFEVSRTPVRKVMTWLAREELLEVVPQKGTYISLIDMDRVHESVLMRTVLSKEAAEIACEKVTQEGLLNLEEAIRYQLLYYDQKEYHLAMQKDEDFHRIIFHIADLRRIWEQMQTIGYDQLRIRYLKLVEGFRWKETIEEHREIVSMIRNNRVGEIGDFLKKHIGQIFKDTEALRTGYSEYFV